jgi:hypothetical protein
VRGKDWRLGTALVLFRALIAGQRVELGWPHREAVKLSGIRGNDEKPRKQVSYEYSLYFPGKLLKASILTINPTSSSS